MTAPQTERGTGILIPATKAAQHLMAIKTAQLYDWPMSNESASTELNHVLEHIDDLATLENLISFNAREILGTWKVEIQETSHEATLAIADMDDTAKEAPFDGSLLPNLDSLITQTWLTLSALDTELTGLTGLQADPGRQP